MNSSGATAQKSKEEQAADPDRRLWSRFLVAWLTMTAALLLAVGAFNVAVDPFLVFDTPLFAGFNKYKPATEGREILGKPSLLRRAQPHTVLVGTSKVQVGVSPHSTIWTADDEPVFNAGLPGSDAASALAVAQDALAAAPVHRVLIFFEPTNFLEPGTLFAPAKPFRQTGWDHIRDLFNATFTFDALEASIRTVVSQWTDFPRGIGPDGQMYDGLFRGPIVNEGPGAVFGQKTATNAAEIVAVARRLAGKPGAQIAQLEAVRRIIVLCQEKHASLDLALAPVHADELRLIVLSGLWPRYLQMLETLAQTVAEAGNNQVHLWGFTGFNTYSTEPVPPIGQRAPALRWFWETNHFRPEYGELQLETIYRGRQGVGELLLPANIMAIDQAQTAAMERDRAAQPAEWARIAKALANARAP
jgi:hypothetical protein